MLERREGERRGLYTVPAGALESAGVCWSVLVCAGTSLCL